MDGDLMSYLNICPTGTIFAFAGTTAPNGWLLCDGSAVNRTVYAQLYSVVGISSGSGDGSTTFNIPDLRGRFLRGVSGLSANDPDKTLRIAMNSGGNTGNSVGSVQGIATSLSSGTQSGTKSTIGLKNDKCDFTVAGSTGLAGNHSHGTNIYTDNTGGTNGPSPNNNYDNIGEIVTRSVGDHSHSFSVSATAPAQSISGDAETRPVNAYVNFIIKA